MRRGSRRPEQVAETIRQVIADAITKDVRDPRIGFATVTAVRVSNDLSHATILVAVPGDEAAKDRALAGLTSASGFLRSRLARALSIRTVPELHMQIDRGLEHAARIDALLQDLHTEDAG